MKLSATLAVLLAASCATRDEGDAPRSDARSENGPAAQAPGAEPSPPDVPPDGGGARPRGALRANAAEWDGSRDVGEAADEAERAEPTKDPVELLARLDLQVRAGHEASALVAMDALRAAQPPVDRGAAAEFVNTLIDSKRDTLALAFLERFPETSAGWTYVLLHRWASDAGWQTVDRWAAERAAVDPPRWLRERIVLRERFGVADELLDELAAKARAAPADTDAFIAWLGARQFAHSETGADWIGDVARPSLAFDATRLGQCLVAARAPKAAVVVLDRSLALPFTEGDARAMREWARRSAAWAGPETPEHWEAVLRRSTRFQLADALLAAGDAARAQTVLESLAADAKTTGELPDLFLAGRIQAGSGARVVERRVVEAEEKEGDTIEYWRRREDYFRGRAEKDRLREAQTRHLALVERDLATATWESAKDRRYFLVNDQEGLTGALSGRRAAFEVLHTELSTMPAELREAGFFLGRVAMDYEQFIDAADPVLWRVLESRSAWDIPEERLLRCMAKSNTGPARETVWVRAEALAAGAPARARVLGWVMTRTDANARAIPLLRTAVAGLTDRDQRAQAALTLVEAAVATGDWRTAEETLPLCSFRLTSREFPKWAAKPALTAAKAGAADDAMRLWAAKVNLDRGELSLLDAMREAGLGERLRDFYAALGTRDPNAAAVVERALAALAK